MNVIAIVEVRLSAVEANCRQLGIASRRRALIWTGPDHVVVTFNVLCNLAFRQFTDADPLFAHWIMTTLSARASTLAVWSINGEEFGEIDATHFFVEAGRLSASLDLLELIGLRDKARLIHAHQELVRRVDTSHVRLARIIKNVLVYAIRGAERD